MTRQIPHHDFSVTPTLYLIGYSHLDAQWCWTYPLVIDEMLRNTLDENFKCIDEAPDYIINFPAANRYRSFKEFYAEDYQHLKQLIAQGKWFPAGSSMEECDVLVPAPESIIRNILYGNLFFEEEFQTTSDEFMLPDCFGFPATLPSLLHHCGLKGFSTQKLSWRSARGIPFNFGWWQGPDGNGILAALNGGSYLTTITDDWSQDPQWMNRLQENQEKQGYPVDFVYIGTGDQGGSAGVESAKWMDKLHNNSQSPIRFISAQADWIFNHTTDEQKEKLKQTACSGDLLLIEHSAGSLTSQAYMKHWFRQAEMHLLNTEPLCVFANLFQCQPYPQKQLRECWYLTTLLMFHDVLPGTSLPKAYEYSHNDALLDLALTQGILTDTAAAIAPLFDSQTNQHTQTVLLYNSQAVSRCDCTEITIQRFTDATDFLAIDNQSQQLIPIQFLRRTNQTITLLVQANLPPLGFKTINILPGSTTLTNPLLQVSASHMENNRYKLTISPDGDIHSIYDKHLQRELLRQPLRLAFMHDDPTNYPSWNMDWKDRKFPPRAYLTGTPKITITEQGPIRIALTIERDCEGSHFAQTIRLYHNPSQDDGIEMFNTIDWRAKSTTLKAVFDLTAANPEATYSWECSTIRRGNNTAEQFEVPTHRWIDLTDLSGEFGVSVFTNAKYGSDKPDDHQLRLTLLYTPGISRNLHHQHQETQDWGRHEFSYAIKAHDSQTTFSEIDAQAQCFNQKIYAFELNHNGNGPLGTAYSLLSIQHSAIKLLALKQCERSTELLMRLNNFSDQPVTGVKIHFGNGLLAAQLADGQERPIGQSLQLEHGQLCLDFAPFEIKTILLQPQPLTCTESPTDTFCDLILPYNFKATSRRNQTEINGFAPDCHGSYTYPAELFPQEIFLDGHRFRLASADIPNALRCRGQQLTLPTATRRITLLAAAETDCIAEFSFDNIICRKKIPSWSGYLGMWDTRIWDRPEPRITWEWGPLYAGLRPGYLNTQRPAWYCQHLHNQNGQSQTYRYGYIFAIELEVPADASTLHLPNDERILIFAAAANTQEKPIRLATTLTDFPSHEDETLFQPRIVATTENGLCRLTLEPPFYHEADLAMEISLNHSPFAPYVKPLMIYETTHVKARYKDHISEQTIEHHDTTAPTITAARRMLQPHQLELTFSKPVQRQLLLQPGNILVNDNQIRHAKLSEDGLRLQLTCTLPCLSTTHVTIHHVVDCSPNANVVKNLTQSIEMPRHYYLPGIIECTDKGYEFDAQGQLPVSKETPWTMNLFVLPTEPLVNNTLIAGFGAIDDEPEQNWGGARFVGKTHTGTCFWFNKMDTGNWIEYDLNKWQMVTVTWDGSVYRLYRNGVETISGSGRINDLSEEKIYIAPRQTWETEKGKEKSFVGQVAELRIIDQVLSHEEILELASRVPEQRINYKTMHLHI